MDVSAKITGVRYTPILCRELKEYELSKIDMALVTDTSFLLKIDKENKIAVSWWVSPKRTRSYPYARVYDTLNFQGKKITIIPVLKDEGKGGDRDFLQWDTISLMSLLGIYVIIGYYKTAEKSSKYSNKITNQRFDTDYIINRVYDVISYQSDALHWNCEELGNVGKIGCIALYYYEQISKAINVSMHSKAFAWKRIGKLIKGRESFINISRELAKNAQDRESKSIQPKEKLHGTKGKLTIENYLGGLYFFTCDEVKIKNNKIILIEGKHSKQSILPSIEDIKDGLIKMILYTNLSEVRVDDIQYNPVALLKLTSGVEFSKGKLSKSQDEFLKKLKQEADKNKFKVEVNGMDLQDIV